MGYFSGRVVAVTGAGAGIGRAVALGLAGQGARLALSDRVESTLGETVAECAAGGAEVTATVVDVTDRAGVLEYAAATAARFGAVDAVFNIAGILYVGGVATSPFTDFEEVLDTDFWGVVNGTKAFLPHIVRSDAGHVVNISSALGLIATADHAPYNAAKFAVRGFTESLRQEMRAHAPSVRVTCVYPGGVRTGIARVARVAPGFDAEAIARRFDDHVARTEVSDAARAILRGAARGKAKVLVGTDARMVDLIARALGSRYERALDRLAEF